MKKSCNLILFFAIVCILFPLFVLLLWSLASRWAWPSLLPQSFSLHGLRELFAGQAFLILHSSISLSAVVAILSVIIGTMSARAIVFYEWKGKKLLLFSSLLPLIVPASVFGMGIHLLLIVLGLSESVAGVILVHVICALPYTVTIMTDSTQAIGKKLEEQARVLGASSVRAFFELSVPALLPAAKSAAVMAYITSFSQYFLTLLIGGGKVRTFTLIMVPFLQNGDRTIASAYSLLFLFVTLLVFAIFHWVFHRKGRNF